MMAKALCLVFLGGLVGALGQMRGTGSFKCLDGTKCTSKLEFEEPLCTAEWGAFPRVNKETNELIMLQFQTSFEYLLISTHFKEWKANRPGLANYFSKLSDDNWDEAVGLLLHMVERGGTLEKDFKVETVAEVDKSSVGVNDLYKLKEVESLSKGLDNERRLATKTLHLAHLANHGAGVPHDAEFAEFLAGRLHHHSVLRIKHLANNVKVLHDIIQDPNVDSSYAIFKFDSEYLQ